MGTIEERIVIDYAQAVAGLRAVSTEAKAAATQVVETQRAAKAAASSLADTATASKAVATTATAAAESTTKATGAARAGAINLGNQFADVAAQMVSGASPFTIAVQQGPQAAAAIASMGSAGLTAAGGLAALGVAVSAGYAAWRIYNAETIRAERIAADLTAAHAELQPLIDSTRRATIDLAEATGQLSPLMADLERNSLRALTAWGNATDETRAKLAALKREQSSVTTQIIDAGQAFYDAVDPTGLLSEGYQRLWGGSRELQTEIDALSGAVDQSIVALRENRQVTEQAAVADNVAKNAKDAHTEAARDQKDALAELKKAQDELWNSVKRENEERKIAVALANAEAALAFSRGATSEAAMQRVGTAGRMAELQALDATVASDRERQIQAMTALATTISLQDAATQENTKALMSASASAAGQGMSTVMGGANSIMGALSNMGGPIGWIAMIAQLVKSIGDGLLDGIHEWAMSLMDTVGRLPTILTDAVVRSIQEGIPALFNMIPDFLEALGQAIPQLVEVLTTELATSIPRVVELLTQTLPAAFENMLRALFDWETWYNVGVQIVKGFSSAVAGTNPTAKKGHGWWNPFGGLINMGEMITGSHDTGAWNVQSRGLYMLHGGERVLTSGQATSARNRSTGGGVTIQIGSVMGGRAGVRELVDLIRRESGPMGSRVSLGV